MPALVRKGALLIREHSDWFAGVDGMNASQITNLWLKEERRALADGYMDLRINGNTAFVPPAAWSAFMDYEEYADAALASRRIVTLCSYRLEPRAAVDVQDIVRRHSCTLDRPDEGWQIVTAR